MDLKIWEQERVVCEERYYEFPQVMAPDAQLCCNESKGLNYQIKG